MLLTVLKLLWHKIQNRVRDRHKLSYSVNTLGEYWINALTIPYDRGSVEVLATVGRLFDALEAEML